MPYLIYDKATRLIVGESEDASPRVRPTEATFWVDSNIEIIPPLMLQADNTLAPATSDVLAAYQKPEDQP